MEYKYSLEKNELLQQTRGVGFEEIISAINNGMILEIEDNPNYPNQKRLVVNYNNYAYIVPYVREEDYIFLKTIYSSRKYNKEFLN